MSGQGPQTGHKVRRNGSPSPRHGPIKAVKPFGINLRNSPCRSPSSPSHTLFSQQGPRRSPVADSRHSPDRRSPGPGSPCSKVERPRPVRVSPNTSQLRRTSSLDTIAGPYLRGHWPTDPGAALQSQPSPQSFVRDETTQTPDEWPNPPAEDVSKAEKKKKKHRRSASFGHADKELGNLSKSNIRQKLQKTKDQSSKQRSSPITANHNALLQTAPAVLMRQSVAIAIPNATAHIPRTNMTRYQRNSVEGLSMEIKDLMLDVCGPEEENERPIEIPDGHRAPVPEVTTRSVDTQTPSGAISDRSSNSPASPANRPISISPATYPMVVGPLENSPRPSSSYDSSGSTPRDKSDKETGDSDSISPDGLKKTASPKPNHIVREPPDGCERVTVVDEDRTRKPSIKEPLFSPIQTQGRFELKPSHGSAFCPLKKYYTTQGTSYKQSSPVTTSILENQPGLTTS